MRSATPPRTRFRRLAFATALLALAAFGAVQARDYRPGIGLQIIRVDHPGDASVNSYVLVGAETIAIVDAQRTAAESQALAALARGLGKPVEAIVLTHEHPDHLGGLATLVDAFPDAPILASAATRDFIASQAKATLDFMRGRFGAAVADRIPAPTRLLAEGERIRLAGVEWTVLQRGPSEARAMTLLHAPSEGLLIASDLVGNRVTPFLAEGTTADWLRELDAVAARFDTGTLALPGHGAAAPAQVLFREQADYLRTFRSTVGDALGDGRVDPDERARIADAIDARYPGHPLVAPMALMDANIDAVAAELLRDAAPTRSGTAEPNPRGATR